MIGGEADVAPSGAAESMDPHLQKALWANIAELRLAESRRRRQQTILTVAVAALVVVLAAFLFTRL